MYKTCFECPHIKILNPKSRRTVYYCPKLFYVYNKPFILDWRGTRPRLCPLLNTKKRKKRGIKK